VVLFVNRLLLALVSSSMAATTLNKKEKFGKLTASTTSQ
jgi:hypothetical protein